MSRGNRRTLLFKDASDHIRFLESIIRAKEIYPFRIHALCLMSNHFHMAVETVDVELWKIMQRILHAKYIHNILTRLIEYLVDGNHSDSRVLTQLAKLLACICGMHDSIFDNVSLIGKLLDNDASERLCVELYSYLGEKSQANIKEKFKKIKIDDNSADYELYGMLVGKNIIPPNKEIENRILKYCLSGKDKGNNKEDCTTNDQLMVIMCDLFLKNKILDLKAFKAVRGYN